MVAAVQTLTTHLGEAQAPPPNTLLGAVDTSLQAINSSRAASAFSVILEEFRQFLSDRCKELDPATTFNLIASHGRTQVCS